MVEAYIIYFVVLMVMFKSATLNTFYSFTKVGVVDLDEKLYWKISLFPILVFTLVFGLRYYVGVDYESYMNSYNDLDTALFKNNEHFEIGFFMLMYILKLFDLHFSFLFIVTSLMQIGLIYYFCKDYYQQLKWIIFFYFTTLYLFESLNIVRQAIAFSIILVSIKYIVNKSFVKYFILVLLAAIFHKSALIFLPFFFLTFLNKFISVKFQLLFFFIAIFFTDAILDVFSSYVFSLSSILNYSEYLGADLFFDRSSSLGLGIYFIVFTYIVIFLYSKKMIDYYEMPMLRIVYVLFYVGALFFFLVEKAESIPLSRLFFYFFSFKIIVLAFLVHYLFNSKKSVANIIIGIVLIVLHIIWFVFAISKNAAWCSPFNFVFQDVDVEALKNIHL